MQDEHHSGFTGSTIARTVQMPGKKIVIQKSTSPGNMNLALIKTFKNKNDQDPVTVGVLLVSIVGAMLMNVQNATSIEGAIPGIKMLMSWVPGIVAVVGAGIMMFYPLTQKKMDEITSILEQRRLDEANTITA